jgi:lysophospholipase L1-like esterase
MIVRRGLLAWVLVTLLASCGAVRSAPETSTRVLFLGNSVTYVGNLPAVLSGLCRASGTQCSTEMIVQGGATLTDRVADSSLERAVANSRFDYLVLQERGGDIMGAQMNQSGAQERAESAAATLVQAARKLRMQPVLLGTYQGSPGASSALVRAERALASRLDVAYVPISNYLECGRRDNASLRWFDRDGMHPGPELTLLMAAMLYRELFNSLPSATEIVVQAPIYPVSSGLRADDFASGQTVLAGTASSITYDAATVRAVLKVADGQCR